MATSVSCPVCLATVPWTDASRWRPFCSERCKLIDLGDWASERHVIAGNPLESPDEQFEQSTGQSEKRRD